MPSSPADPAVSTDARRARSLDALALRAGLERCSRIVARHARHLTALDAVLGDGDHGDNLVIGLRAVDELLAELPASTPPGEILQAVGHRLVAAVGGASGPLYGTACIEAGFVAGGRPVLDGPRLAAMFRAAAAGLARRGRCQPGDKTILDTLAPAADAFAHAIDAGETVPAAYAAALRAGLDGMRSTRDLVARRGLALRLGRAIGRSPRPGRRLVPAPAVRPGRPMSDRADLLARIEALERESRRAFDDAQREADALFAQYQLSQLVASGGSLESLARSVTLEVVRLAGVDGGALWLGGPGRPGAHAGRVGRRDGAAGGGGSGVPTALGDRRTRAGAGARTCPAGARSSCPTRLPRSCSGCGAPTGARPDPDGIRVVQLARHELVVAFRSARLRETLERERGELTAVVDGTTDLIVQVDGERRVVRLNPAGERLLGIAVGGRPRPDVRRGARLRGRRRPRTGRLPARSRS